MLENTIYHLIEEPVVTRFESGDEVFNYLHEHADQSYRHGYRGHRNEGWNLESTIWRYIQEVRKNFGSQRKRRLECVYRTVFENLEYYFKQNVLVNGDITQAKLDKIDIWQFGQHFGLPTPLIDWTDSPYVALFFALNESSVSTTEIKEKKLPNNTNDRCIWLIDTYLLNFINEAVIDEIRPKNKGSIKTESALNDFYPTLDVKRELSRGNKRIRYQQGFFVQPGNLASIEVWVDRIGKAMHTPRMGSPFLQKLVFPCTEGERIKMLDKLDLMNINNRTLFPDVEGSVKDAADRTFRNFLNSGETLSFSSTTRDR